MKKIMKYLLRNLTLTYRKGKKDYYSNFMLGGFGGTGVVVNNPDEFEKDFYKFLNKWIEKHRVKNF